MQWTLGLTFTLMASFAGCAAVTGGASWENKWLKTGPNGVILTDGVLFDVATRSRIDCARLCAKTSDCVTFTSAQTGAAVSCRGHSSSVTLGSLASPVQWERVLHRTDSTPNVPLNLLTTSGDLLVLADLATAAMTTAGDANLTTAAMTTAGDVDLTTAAMTTAGDADLTTAAMTTAGDADLTTAAMTTADDADLTTAAMTTGGDAGFATASMTTTGDSSSPSGVQETSSQSDPMTSESVTTVLSTPDAPLNMPPDTGSPLIPDDLTTSAEATAADSSSPSVAQETSSQSHPVTRESVTTAAGDMSDVSTPVAPTASGQTTPVTTIGLSSQGPAEVPVIGSACDDDSDCVTSAGFACFVSSGQCLCIPGYYFSESSNACVETCAETDLLDSYMLYPDSGTDGANIASLLGKTLEECKVRCNDKAACLTFEFDDDVPFFSTTCNLQSVTPLTAKPGDWKPGTDPGWDTYQRKCA